MSLQIKDVEYQGFFLDEESIIKLKQYITTIGQRMLLRKTAHPHVTFKFEPKELLPDSVLNRKLSIRVIGYANDGVNQGFAVKLPGELETLYDGQAQKHITFSLGEEGRAVKTGQMEFSPIEPLTVTGYMAFCLNGTGNIARSK